MLNYTFTFAFTSSAYTRVINFGHFFSKKYTSTYSVHSYFRRGSHYYHRSYAHSNTHLFPIKSTGTVVWNNIPPAIRFSVLGDFQNKTMLPLG